MRKVLLTTAALIALTSVATAAVIQNLGVNPTSSQGDFSNSVGGGPFSDQFTFQLVGGPQFVAIGSATNVFPNNTDFISGWTAAIFQQVGAIPNPATDPVVLGPQSATPCTVPNCQTVAGTALMNPGNYYIDFEGVGGGTSGYGGNLSVTPVGIPGPIAGAGLPGLLAAMAGLWGYYKRRRNPVHGAAAA